MQAVEPVHDIAESQHSSAVARPDDGLSSEQFKLYLQECRWQPPWRNMADKCADYYDGNQLDQDTLATLDKRGMGPLQRNIIQPLINTVLGMEAKLRTDWRVSADDDVVQDVAEALSTKLHETERETRADRSCSDGYAAQVKAGLGWVEVSRTSDPFLYPYRTQYVHRREIWWDWRDESPDLHKARFLNRKRWFDVDQASAYFPEHKELLQSAVGDPNRYEILVSKRALDLGQDLEESRGLDLEDYEEWRSFDRRRVALYEMWYRVYTRGLVARLPNGEVLECDRKNPVHVALYNAGAIRPYMAVYSKLRASIWCGPHKLMDTPSMKRYCPYVPFWGYREDRTGVPYGLVRAMVVPQDEVNARLQKMMWLLGAKRVIMDSDALDQSVQSPQDMLNELARPDAVIFRNKNRKNADALTIDDNLTLADAQYKILQDAMQSAQQVVGVFNAMLGRESSATSGTAINSLVEQGTTALAEINDNYHYSRRLVGERLLDLIREDMIGQRVDVIVGEQGRKRTISLNKRVKLTPEQAKQVEQGGRVPANAPEVGRMMQMTEGEQAVLHMQNDVQSARVRVSLDDVPSTNSYREQQFVMLAEMTKGLPPQLQAVIAPFIMEASDLRKRREMADALRKAMGTPVPKTPEEEQAMEQAAAEAQQFAIQVQREQALLELRERQAKVDKLNVETKKMLSEIEGNPALVGAQGEFAKRAADMEARAKDQIDKLTATLMQVRMDAAKREQVLLGKLTETIATLKSNAADRNAEIEKANIEKEIAEINAKKDVEVAEIEANAKKVGDGYAAELVALRNELSKKVEDERAAREKAEIKAKAEAEKRAHEGERRAADSKKSETPTPAQPAVTVVLAEEPRSEESEVRVRKVGDEWVGTKTTKGKARTVKVKDKKGDDK
jgi:hypothetical protein